MDDDIRALKEALAAGPTPGPWIDDRHEKAVYPYTQVRAPNDRGARDVVMDVRLSDIGSFCCTVGKSEQEWVNAAYIAAASPDRIARLLDRLEAAERRPAAEPFVVKNYSGDERPIIKGNGFDGLEVGEDREDAERFVAWVNERICAAMKDAP
jgi:hypothetical protein